MVHYFQQNRVVKEKQKLNLQLGREGLDGWYLQSGSSLLGWDWEAEILYWEGAKKKMGI